MSVGMTYLEGVITQRKEGTDFKQRTAIGLGVKDGRRIYPL